MFKLGKNTEPHPFFSCVLVAAGASTRMGEDKLMIDLGGLPLVVRTLRALDACVCLDEIVIVTKSEKIPMFSDLIRAFSIEKVKHIVTGGETRMESALQGVRLCSPEAELIGVHDGARPFADPELISGVARAASEHGAAAPAITCRDTVRLARGGKVTKTLDRDSVYLMQTPQVFRADLLRRALESAVRLGLTLTDDVEAVMLEDAEAEVWLVEGSDQNIKLTTPVDIAVARAILEERGEW